MPSASLAEGVAQSPAAVRSPAFSVRPGWISALIVAVGLTGAVGGRLIHAYLIKDITIVVGDRAVARATYKRTVGQALLEAGVRLAPDDEVSPARSTRLREGLRVVVRRAVPITLKVDGKTVALTSAAPTVRDVLRRRHVIVHAQDKVFPAPSAAPAAGTTIRVVRIQHRVIVEQIDVPYDVQFSRDPMTPHGSVRVKAPGQTGLKERAFKITLADGTAVSRRLVGERVVRTPLDRITMIGSLVPVASRGQLAGREVLQMVATAYSPYCCPGVDDITATGMYAGYGVVAVDPRVIPLRSRLYVEGYGYAVAGDTGSWIKGMRIDLGFATRGEAIRYGRRPVRVYILQKHEKKKS